MTTLRWSAMAVMRPELQISPSAFLFTGVNSRAELVTSPRANARNGALLLARGLTGILSFLPSTYSARQYERSLLTMTLIRLKLMLKTFQHLQHINRIIPPSTTTKCTHLRRSQRIHSLKQQHETFSNMGRSQKHHRAIYLFS